MKPNNERTIKKLPPNFNCFDEHSEQTIPIKDVLSEFEYLGRENAEEVVIKNLEKIMGYIKVTLKNYWRFPQANLG